MVRMLLLHDLVHKDCFVDALGGIEASRTITVALLLMLVAEWDRTANKERRDERD